MDVDQNNNEDKTFLCPGFKALDKLGAGTYGTVYKAVRIDNPNEICAVKKIKLDVESEGVPSTTLREISILKKMKHPNIVW